MKPAMLKLAILVAFLAASASAATDQPTVVLKAAAARHAFEQGQFKDSARILEEIVAATSANGAENGHVYYNLGNAYFRDGERGQAVAAYLGARRLLPRDPDVRANLKHALNQLPDKLYATIQPRLIDSLMFWRAIATPKELAWGAAFFCFLAGISTGIGLIDSAKIPTRLRTLLRRSALGAGASALLLAFAGITASWRTERWGAVVSKAPVGVMTQAAAGAKPVFELREGAPFRVASEAPGWYKIELSDGKTGWIASKDVRAY